MRETTQGGPGGLLPRPVCPHFLPLCTTSFHSLPLCTTLYHWARKPRRKAMPDGIPALPPQTDRVSSQTTPRAARFPAPNMTLITWLHMFSGASSPYYTILCVYTGQTRFFYGCTIGRIHFLYTSFSPCLYSSCGCITDGTNFADAEIRAYPRR
jgi:hypothetical protein